ncbi:unnamed protein product [Nyctereutes procyonoides]|uniref:(raccoon dog) hypothetical protein n=1 Tax=Nyctereutes procyonoides TaxID=34880 RepID=A0A811YYM3_NYCPR|nr:unnamed protein product [Nyctereutes procyonoides]
MPEWLSGGASVFSSGPDPGVAGLSPASGSPGKPASPFTSVSASLSTCHPALGAARMEPGCGFINSNDTKEVVFKSLGSVGDGETVECAVVEGEKGGPPANYQKNKNEAKKEDGENAPEGQVQLHWLYPTSEDGADKEAAGEQGRPVDHNVFQGYRPQFGRTAMNKIRKIKKMRPKVSSHLNVGTTSTSVTNTDSQKTINHKMAKRQKHPTRINEYKIPAIRNDQKIGAEDFKCFLFAH